MKTPVSLPRLALIDLERFTREAIDIADSPDELDAITACVERARCEQVVLELAAILSTAQADHKPDSPLANAPDSLA